jgi:hypothetical protein
VSGRWGRRGLLVAALVLVLAGCADDDGLGPRVSAEVVSVLVGPDDRALLVSLGGTGTGGEVTAVERSDEVRLVGTAFEECPPNALCVGMTRPLRLDAPLGDRRLVDDLTGEPIADVTSCHRASACELQAGMEFPDGVAGSIPASQD